MPIRLHFIHTKFPHWGRQSGYLQLINHIDCNRFSCSLTGTPDAENADDLPAILSSLTPWLKNWIKIRSGMPWYKLPDLSAELYAWRMCAQNQVDTIHFLDGEHCGAFLPRAIKKAGLSKIRTVASYHQPGELLDGLIDPSTLQWLDAIVLMSPSQLPFFRRYVCEDKLHVILHGTNVDYFHPPRRRKRSSVIRCVTVGHWLRDWDMFRAVATRLPNIRFDVVGTQARDISDISNVSICKGISDEALAELYRQADIMFLPLIESTANNALLEGIASGLPVVSTDLKSVRSYLPDDIAILVADHQPQSYVDAICELAENSTLRSEMEVRSLKRARELSWRQQVRQYETLYERLLGSIHDRGALSSQRGLLNTSGKSRLKGSSSVETPVPWVAVRAQRHAYGMKLLDARHYRKAEEFFEEICSTDFGDYRSYSLLARVKEQQWKWRQALESLDRCIDYAPQGLRASFEGRKANAHIRLGEIDQARLILTPLQDHFEGLAGLARIAELEDRMVAENRWNECTIRFPNQIGGFLGKARNLMNKGSLDEADSLLGHIRRVWPDSSAVAALWADCPMLRRDWDEAELRWAMIRKAHHKSRYITFAHTWHDRALEFARGPAAGESSRQDARNSVESDWLEVFRETATPQAVLERAQRLVEQAPEEPLAHVFLASLLMSLGGSSYYRQALKILRSMREQDDIIIKLRLCEVYFRLNNSDAALKVFHDLPSSYRSIVWHICDIRAKVQKSGSGEDISMWESIFLRFNLFGSGEDEFWSAFGCGWNYLISPREWEECGAIVSIKRE